MDLKRRLDSVIKKDKDNNYSNVINVIKSDFYYLINNYFEVDFEDLKIDILIKDDKYKIVVDCVGDRMKNMRVVP